MSYFDSASLAFLPSSGAGKDGKAYSIKPTDGTGDFTFSRGSNLAATRVGADGLIEKGRENLLLQSNQFDTTWVEINGSVTGGQSGYDGSSDAWLLSKTAANGRTNQNVSQSGVQTFSVYAKANTATWLKLQVWDGSSFYTTSFDLSTGAIGSLFNLIDANTENVGGGWYRCSISLNANNQLLYIYPAEADNDTSATTGSIYIQDSQLEIGLAATDYIESGATTGKAGLLEDEPRFDYSGGATCPSLLLEPSRTQLVTQSEYLLGYFATDGTTLSHNQGVSPEGVQNSVLITQTGGVASNSIYNFNLPTTDGSYTYSFFFKAGTSTLCRFYCGTGVTENFNPQNVNAGYTGGSLNLFFEDYGSGWWRVSATQTLSGASTNRFAFNPDFQNNGGNVEVYGFQIEQASYPTSYIPNHSGGTITRGADGSTTGDISSLVNSPEGTIFIEFAKIEDFSSFQLDDRTQNNRITLYPRNNTTQITFIFAVGGVEVIRQNPSPSGLDTSQFNKYAIAWGLNDFRVYVNGVNIYTSTSNITFGSGALDDVDFYGGKHRQLLLFPEALSDADCITLTTI